MKKIFWYIPACALLATAGCGKSEVATPTSTGTTTQPVVAAENPVQANTPAGDDRDSFKPSDIVNAPAKELPVTADSKPDVVVREFLNALKSGNDGVTAGLLTPLARTETAKHNLAVQPPGTPTALYQITAAEIDMQDPTLSQVACLWTETDDQGVKRNDEVICQNRG
jgi:hypothetical protein